MDSAARKVGLVLGCLALAGACGGGSGGATDARGSGGAAGSGGGTGGNGSGGATGGAAATGGTDGGTRDSPGTVTGDAGANGPAAQFCATWAAAFCQKVYTCTPVAEQDAFFHALFGPNQSQCTQGYTRLCSDPPGAAMFDVNCYGKTPDPGAGKTCLDHLDAVSCAAFNDPGYHDNCGAVCVVGGVDAGSAGTGGVGGDAGTDAGASGGNKADAAPDLAPDAAADAAVDARADAGAADSARDSIVADSIRGGDGAVPVGTTTPDCVNGWCWVNPTPQGEQLAIWAASATDAWAVGPAGQIRHFNGTDWKRVASGTTDDFTAVYGTAANDVWAVGDAGLLARWNGTAWTMLPRPTTNRLLSILVRSANDIWVAQQDTYPLHYDGAQWSQRYPGFSAPWVQKVIGTPDGTVFMQGFGEIGRLRPGETDFTAVAHFAAGDVNDLWAAGPTDAWVTGLHQTSHFDGTKWTAVDLGLPRDNFLLAIAGTGSSDVWFFGLPGLAYHYNGSLFEPWATGTTRDLVAAFARAPGDVWVTGRVGQLMRFQPSGFQRYDHGTETWNVFAAWASSPDDVWAAGGDGLLLRYHAATGWRPVDSGTQFQITALWGSAADDIWAVGAGGIVLHWNGTAWSSVPSGTLARFVAVWGSGPSDVWAVGWDGALGRWNGTKWTTTDPGSSWRGVWGSAANDVWLIDSTSTNNVWHWDGTAFTKTTVRGANGGVWGRSRNEVYSWGNDAFLRWDGTAWKDLKRPPQRLGFVLSVAVGGAPAGDLWVAVNGSVTRWNGSAWSAYDDVIHSQLTTVAVTASDVWALGVGGAILRHAP